MKLHTTKPAYLVGPLLLTLCLGAGCSDDDAGGPVPVEGAEYLLGSREFTPDGEMTTSYFHLLRSLDAGTPVARNEGMEVGGSAKLFSIGANDWLAIGDGESPKLTRYVVEDGLLEARASLSLLSYGVESLWDTLYVIGEDKVYYPDRDNQQLIILDPKRMKVLGSISLPETAREGYLALYSYASLEREGKLLFSVGWFDWTDDRVLNETGLVVIDTATDSVERVDVDSRCGGVTQPVTLENGDTYFISSALTAAAHKVGRPASRPCALRILAGEEKFDAEYIRELDGVTSHAVVGEPMPAGGQAVYLRALNEGDVDLEEAEASWDLTAATAWEWWRWELGEDEAEKVDLPAATSDVVWFSVDGRVLGAQTEADYSESTLIDFSDEDGPKSLLKAPGFILGVAKLD